ncbi:MAG: nickel pincer cofactor biosynthesis protein LarB [Thermodesulfovibrionales bacterium]|nr:nickel pincer cofactor biosynthesis protein LarB [Thermodesulfovibrionales bacterium]
MDIQRLKGILEDLKNGKIEIDTALERLKYLPYEDLDIVKIDHHRDIRTNIPEVIFALNKKKEDIIKIARNMLKRSGRFLITRASREIYDGLRCKKAKFYPSSGVICYGEKKDKKGKVLIISAGTSDIPIAEEAEVVASYLGSKTERLYDVGVAGLHRLLINNHMLQQANVIVVVAGMEGALPSVVGGLTDKPVIAVPTSIGYGANLDGFSALLTMLNSCVPGIAVVNIDNGFGAGCLAHKINMLSIKEE